MLIQLLKPRFLWALLAFAAVSQCLAIFEPAGMQTNVSGEQTWTSWAVDHFTNGLAQAPQVVFLGSSLVLTPINMSDAEVLGVTLDGSQHHESVYFARLIEKFTGRHIQTFNFALPGEMPSDAFLITKLLLKGKKRPEMIIYGVGPRDFMDNLLSEPAATDPYRCLSRFGDQALDKSFVGDGLTKQLNLWLNRLIYPYAQKEKISSQFAFSAKQSIAKAFPHAIANQSFSSKQVRALLPQYHPMNIAVGECLFQPIVEQRNNRFNDNLEEYRRRYGSLNWDTFLTQLNFLAKFLDIARAQHTEAVVVAMPITEVNRKLIPSLSWQAYKWSLRVITASKGARFIDLEGVHQFNDDDFGDTVHLNTIGGIKLVQLLVADLLQNYKPRPASEYTGPMHRLEAGKGAAL